MMGSPQVIVRQMIIGASKGAGPNSKVIAAVKELLISIRTITGETSTHMSMAQMGRGQVL